MVERYYFFDTLLHKYLPPRRFWPIIWAWICQYAVTVYPVQYSTRPVYRVSKIFSQYAHM